MRFFTFWLNIYSWDQLPDTVKWIIYTHKGCMLLWSCLFFGIVVRDQPFSRQNLGGSIAYLRCCSKLRAKHWQISCYLAVYALYIIFTMTEEGHPHSRCIICYWIARKVRCLLWHCGLVRTFLLFSPLAIPTLCPTSNAKSWLNILSFKFTIGECYPIDKCAPRYETVQDQLVQQLAIWKY